MDASTKVAPVIKKTITKTLRLDFTADEIETIVKEHVLREYRYLKDWKIECSLSDEKGEGYDISCSVNASTTAEK